MTRVKEIVQFVKERRGYHGGQRIKMTGPGGGTVDGLCTHSSEIADKFGGQYWRSNEAVGKRGQVFPGHSLAIVNTRNNSGVVVDFTDTEKTIIGYINEVDNPKAVGEKLKEITGFGGWQKK